MVTLTDAFCHVMCAFCCSLSHSMALGLRVFSFLLFFFVLFFRTLGHTGGTWVEWLYELYDGRIASLAIGAFSFVMMMLCRFAARLLVRSTL